MAPLDEFSFVLLFPFCDNSEGPRPWPFVGSLAFPLGSWTRFFDLLLCGFGTSTCSTVASFSEMPRWVATIVVTSACSDELDLSPRVRFGISLSFSVAALRLFFFFGEVLGDSSRPWEILVVVQQILEFIIQWRNIRGSILFFLLLLWMPSPPGEYQQSSILEQSLVRQMHSPVH